MTGLLPAVKRREGDTQSPRAARLVEEVEARKLPIFLVSFSPQSGETSSSSSRRTLVEAVKYGGLFAVEQSHLIQAAVMTILGRVDRIHSQALHHSRHLARTGVRSVR